MTKEPISQMVPFREQLGAHHLVGPMLCACCTGDSRAGAAQEQGLPKWTSPGAYDRPARPGQQGFGSQEGRTRGHAGTAGPQDSRRG